MFGNLQLALVQDAGTLVHERDACKELGKELTMPAALPAAVDRPAGCWTLHRRVHSSRKVFHTFPDNTGHRLLAVLGQQTNTPTMRRVETPGNRESVLVNRL